MASVAVEGEVVATKNPATTGGTWKVVEPGVSYKTYDHLTIGGKKVIHEASCDFDFVTSSGTTRVPVVLRADPTALQHGSHGVLLDGQSNEDQHNRLEVQVKRKAALTT